MSLKCDYCKKRFFTMGYLGDTDGKLFIVNLCETHWKMFIKQENEKE